MSFKHAIPTFQAGVSRCPMKNAIEIYGLGTVYALVSFPAQYFSLHSLTNNTKCLSALSSSIGEQISAAFLSFLRFFFLPHLEFASWTFHLAWCAGCDGWEFTHPTFKVCFFLLSLSRLFTLSYPVVHVNDCECFLYKGFYSKLRIDKVISNYNTQSFSFIACCTLCFSVVASQLVSHCLFFSKY